MSVSPPTGNRLLDALPRSEYARLAVHLTAAPLASGDVVAQNHAACPSVYFPAGGVLSVLAALSDGSTIEAFTVGREGCFGTETLLNPDAVASRTICQIPGGAYAVSQAAFRDVYAECPAFAEAIRRSLYERMTFLAQSLACNQFHVVPERCARWLLTTRDRTGSEEFPLTQEFLALMLGVQRPTVSVAASALAEAGLIRYVRGRVTIVDPAGLRKASCECYEATAVRD